MRTRSWSFVIVAGIVVAGVLLWSFRTGEGSEGPGDGVRPALPDLGAPRAPGKAGQAAAQESGDPSGLQRVAIAEPSGAVEFLVITQESEAAIEGVGLYSISSEGEALDYQRLPCLQSSDGEGRIVWRPAGESFLLFRKAGFVPSVVSAEECIGADARVPVMMRPSSSLRVSVTDDKGLPVQGASVVTRVHSYGSFGGAGRPVDGNPLAKFPLWCRITDGFGKCVFDEMPSGEFFVSAKHPDYAPHAMHHLRQRIELHGDMLLSFVFKTLYGVVFECPSDSPVTHAYWSVDESKLEISGGHVVLAAAEGRLALQERFPDGLVYVHRPTNVGEDLIVRICAITRDDMVWRGEWPLRPVSEIVEPVFLEADPDTVVRSLKCALVTPSGRRLDVPLLWQNIEEKYRIGSEPDGRYKLPAGTYRVGLARATRDVRSEMKRLRIQIALDSPVGDELLIPLENEWLPMTLVGKFSGQRGLSVVHAKIDIEGGGGMMIANWQAATEAASLLVPAGPVAIRAYSVAYEEANIRVDVKEPLTVEIPLVEK